MPRVSRAYLERRRLQILDAAARCFAREGFHRTTMRHIVRETGLSPGAIYRYFGSKQGLVAAIAARRHAAEQELLHAASAAADVGAGLRQLARDFLGRLASPEERRWRRVTVQLWSEALRNEGVMRIVREGLDEPLGSVAALIRKGQRAGRLRAALDPAATARVAAAVFQGLVLQQAWDPRLDVRRYVRAAEALLDGAASPAVFRSVGHAVTPFTNTAQIPKGPGTRHTAEGFLEIDAELEAGLQDVEGFSHLYVLWVFHRAKGYALLGTPPTDTRPHGVFATRSPRRPNPIGLSVVELLAREGRRLRVRGLDMLDGTPILDIKPYTSSVPDAALRRGWMADARPPAIRK